MGDKDPGRLGSLTATLRVVYSHPAPAASGAEIELVMRSEIRSVPATLRE
jgi:hypothetical protein